MSTSNLDGYVSKTSTDVGNQAAARQLGPVKGCESAQMNNLSNQKKRRHQLTIQYHLGRMVFVCVSHDVCESLSPVVILWFVHDFPVRALSMQAFLCGTFARLFRQLDPWIFHGFDKVGGTLN